jgi:hypothetical protein
MNKIFTAFFTLFLLTSLVFGQGPDTIRYSFNVDIPAMGLVTTGEGSVLEGSSISFEPHTFSNKPDIQEAYNAIVGSSITIPANFVKENVTLSITLGNFNPTGGGYLNLPNGNTSIPLFMYFKIAVIGDLSGPHSAAEHYPGGWPTPQDTVFVNPAVLTIPLSESLRNFCAKYNIDDKQLAFFYDKGGSITTDGIKTDTANGNLIVTIQHFSRFGGSGRTKLTDVSDRNNNVLLKEFRLEQNYPNPFNPTTNISYNLPKEGFVSMKVYNTIGAEVMTLVSGSQKAGAHEVVFNAANLTSGVYFYTLRFDNNSQTKRMILIK